MLKRIFLGMALLVGACGWSVADEALKRPPAPEIDKVTIAVDRAKEMARFYTEVFGAELKPMPMGDAEMFCGRLGRLELILCPKSVAGIRARENTVQLRFVVQDLVQTIDAAVAAGGKKLGEIQKVGLLRSGAVRDPDGYSIELIQKN